MARILIVDDASFMRLVLRNVLQGAGHEVVGEAANGQAGVEKYMELKPDLTLMDMVMPELGGVDAVKKILELDRGARVLMCSATGQEALIQQAREAGVKGFVSKPFQEAVVLQAVNECLAS